MQLHNFKSMDAHILLSLVNTKLRNEFDSIDSLCGYYEIDQPELLDMLSLHGYQYNVCNNQFKSNFAQTISI